MNRMEDITSLEDNSSELNEIEDTKFLEENSNELNEMEDAANLEEYSSAKNEMEDPTNMKDKDFGRTKGLGNAFEAKDNIVPTASELPNVTFNNGALNVLPTVPHPNVNTALFWGVNQNVEPNAFHGGIGSSFPFSENYMQDNQNLHGNDRSNTFHQRWHN
ncbi:hypothetical protein ACE6H2_022259 [Prunus campanulata]